MKLTSIKPNGLKLLCMTALMAFGGRLYATNPTNVSLWCLDIHPISYAQINDPSYVNYDFVHQRYNEYNAQKEQFQLLNGDLSHRGDGTIDARLELYQQSWHPNQAVWHHYDAMITVKAFDPAGDYCLVQIFNDLAGHSAPDLQVRFKNGKLYTSDHGASGGPQTLKTGLAAGDIFHLQIESNGYEQNVYVNGVLEYHHTPYTTDPNSPLNWRWGIYSNDKINAYVHTIVEILRID